MGIADKTSGCLIPVITPSCKLRGITFKKQPAQAPWALVKSY